MSSGGGAGSSGLDRQVLHVFHRETCGSRWNNRRGWAENAADLRDWFGVQCSLPQSTERNGRVVVLTMTVDELTGNGLVGTIPAELGRLESLMKLDLRVNNLSGRIPPELGQLVALETLGLARNELDGSIPPEFGQLRALKELYLSFNQLSGRIPSELGRLGAMVQLNISENKLSGSIPPELGCLDALTQLSISGNKLSGSIPPELGQLSALEGLSLVHNRLSGSIPSGLGQLRALKGLHLSFNQLIGSIPPELGQLSALETLWLAGNQLSGSIPPELGQQEALKTMLIYRNQLSGPLTDKIAKVLTMDCRAIPSELGTLSSVERLSLFGNQLSGNIPPKLGELEGLHELDISVNQLSGIIPSELGQLSALLQLNLSENKLSGSIPPELGQLGALVKLQIFHNHLSGSLPPELGTLSALKRLDLSFNQLWGRIPPELGKPGALLEIDLSYNQLSGSVPPELGELGTLKQLYLSHNKLSGNIPLELGQLSSLEQIDLSENQLSGNVPPELGQLGALMQLTLFENQLSGNIPPELGQLGALTKLNMSFNELTGSIPPELGQLSALMEMSISGNQLSGEIDATRTYRWGTTLLALWADFGDIEEALNLVTHLELVKHRGGKVQLEDNPWRKPPEAIVEKGLGAVRKYLSDVLDAKNSGASAASLHLLKVVVVGSSRAGKTSLIRTIVRQHASPTEGTAEEASTVGIELHRHRLDKTSIEFYDCAGQLDYAGMHQTFLSRRALYLVVWDIQTFEGRTGDDLDKILQDDIMTWLYTLHLRSPGSAVIFVANKCDGSVDQYAEITDKIEARAKALLQEWQHNRGFGDHGTRGIKRLTVLPCASRVSCLDFIGVPALIERISAHDATAIEVPPSWELALKVVDALRDGSAPQIAAQRHLGLGVAASKNDGAEFIEQRFVTKPQLIRDWRRIVRDLAFEVIAVGQMAAISNPEGALDGALWISEFAGHILLVDGGDGIFLDVVWLSRVLSPILSIKLDRKLFPASDLTYMRNELVSNGILRLDFAQYLWKEQLGEGALQLEGIVPTLFRVLLKLGVVLPLGKTTSLGNNGHSSQFSPVESTTPQDALVLMRLPHACSPARQTVLDAHTSQALQDAREVTFRWRFDAAGAPFGLIERLIACCHRIGKVETGACWRYGAMFKSNVTMEEGGNTFRLYTAILRYDAPVLTVRMIGPLKDERVWTALRYVASAMTILSYEWPGVLWEGWPECPEHREDVMLLAMPREARIGDLLLPSAAPGAQRRGCDCQSRVNTVLWLTVQRLGKIINTREGDPYEDETKVQPEPAGPLREQPILSPLHEPTSDHCQMVYDFFRRNAWYAATCQGGLALTLFFGATMVGLVEGKDALWKASLPLVLLLLVGASVSSVVAFRAVMEQADPRPRRRVAPSPLSPPVLLPSVEVSMVERC